MATRIGLETVVQELPDTVVSASEYEHLRQFIPENIKDTFKGPEEIRRFRDNDAAEILAERVVEKALDRAGLDPSDIDYIIANNTGGKYNIPMVGCYIHHKGGFPREVPVLNTQNACSSFVDGIWLAQNLILGGNYKRILVVTVSAWETIGGQGRIDLTDFLGVLMGDGAGAGIVSQENLICEFLSYYNRTFGEIYDTVGTFVKEPEHPEIPEAENQPPIGVFLHTRPSFYEWWQKNWDDFGIDSINGALKAANLALDDVDKVIFHQPFDMLYDHWIDGAAKAGLDKDKWIHTWNKYGNLSNSVIPVNLAEFWDEGILEPNSIVALLTLGAGFHMPTMIIRWLAEQRRA